MINGGSELFEALAETLDPDLLDRVVGIREKATARNNPDILADVILPAVAMAAGAFGVPAGIGIVWLAWTIPEWRLVPVGIGCSGSGLVLAVATYFFMRFYQNLRRPRLEIEVQRDIKKEPAEEEIAARLIVADPADPSHMTVTARHWKSSELDAIADLTHNPDTTWKGPARLTRDSLKGVITNVSDSSVWKAVQRDLRSWNWLDEDNIWTEKGREDLRNRMIDKK